MLGDTGRRLPLRRLQRADKWLLATLLPLFAVVFALHAREAARTGLQQPPFFATPEWGGGPYPVVGGPRLERGLDAQGMRVGDRLISVGGEDLAGVGYLGFDAVALERAGASDRVSLVYERGGVRHETQLRLLPYPVPWFRMPIVLSLVAVALLILLRAPGRVGSRAFFAGVVSCAILETPFLGGPRLQSLASGALFLFGGPVAIVLLLRAMVLFPEEVPEGRRASTAWAWCGLLHIGVRLNYLLGGPLPTAWTPLATLATDALLFSIGLGLFTWNYAHAAPVGRRRARWALLGLYLGAGPMVLTLLLRALLPDGVAEPFAQLFLWSALAAVAIPGGFLVAVLRYNLFDIDRLWSATATVSLAAVAVGALLVGVAPLVASALADLTGLDPGTARLALGLALGVAAVPAHRRLRAGVDQLLFPHRVEQERRLEQLHRDLGHCASAEEVQQLLVARLAAVLRPERCAVYARVADRFQRTLSHGDARVAGFDARGGLALWLEGGPAALLPGGGTARRGRAELSGEEREAVLASGYQVFLPLRRGHELVSFLALGPPRSGDVYTRSDLSLLRSLAERASAEMQRLYDEHRIRAERGRAERMRALKEAAESAQAARSRFLAAASHDLRQPLHALAMYAELLADRVEDGEAREVLERLRASGESLREMFSSLLDVSRLDVGAVEPEPRDFALAPVLEQVVADVAPLAASKGLALRLDASDAVVASDPVLLARIVRNLLANAVRYTERGGVHLACEPLGAHLSIEVRDTGPGIAPERQAEIFEEFVRGDAAAGTEGLGLGLSVVDRLARALGHDVSLESEPGKGSVFRVRVPRRLPGDAVPEPRPLSPASLQGRLVVLVDDDLAVLGAVRALLEGWGCRVLAAAEVEEALEGLARLERAPDVLLCDYRLASGTGVEAVRALRAAVGAPLPAAIVTGETSGAVVQEVRAEGLAYLAKPASAARLRALLASLLRSKEADDVGQRAARRSRAKGPEPERER